MFGADQQTDHIGDVESIDNFIDKKNKEQAHLLCSLMNKNDRSPLFDDVSLHYNN